MKKIVVFILAMVCLLSMTACSNGKQEGASKYSFSFRGENEYFAISNGIILLEETEEVFEGGNLEIVQTDLFKDVVSVSTTFYTMRNGEKYIILSNSVTSKEDGSLTVDGELGKISGSDIIGRTDENMDELRKNLWFELKTTDLNNKENTYQLKLTLSE